RDLLQAELASESRDVELLARDLTLRKRELDTALESARVARDLAERASRMKTGILALLSHELRTPISSLLLQIESALPVSPEEGQTAAVQRMRFTARRLADLIASLLDYAAIESGRLDVRLEALNPGALAEEVLQELEPHAGQKGLDLRLRVPQDLPALDTDRRLLRLVLTNLIGNAVKFTERGTGTVSLDRHTDNHSFEVSDPGPGIATEDLRSIVEPFEQLTPTSHKQVSGVGLGLALVQQLVAALHGDLRVESEVGRGSTFRLVLPSHPAR